MTDLSIAFVADQGTAVHVENVTRSKAERCFVALCGNRFVHATRTSQRTTCGTCCVYDNPFDTGRVPYAPSMWVTATGSQRNALLSRDLITTQGVITPRGAMLAQDLTCPTPWVDVKGITHARVPLRISDARRAEGACGTNLLGIGSGGPGKMSYAKLARATELYTNATVDCMTCLTFMARSS